MVIRKSGKTDFDYFPQEFFAADPGAGGTADQGAGSGQGGPGSTGSGSSGSGGGSSGGISGSGSGPLGGTGASNLIGGGSATYNPGGNTTNTLYPAKTAQAVTGFLRTQTIPVPNGVKAALGTSIDASFYYIECGGPKITNVVADETSLVPYIDKAGVYSGQFTGNPADPNDCWLFVTAVDPKNLMDVPNCPPCTGPSLNDLAQMAKDCETNCGKLKIITDSNGCIIPDPANPCVPATCPSGWASCKDVPSCPAGYHVVQDGCCCQCQADGAASGGGDGSGGQQAGGGTGGGLSGGGTGGNTGAGGGEFDLGVGDSTGKKEEAVVTPQPAANYTPYVIAGAVGVGLLGFFMYMNKKRRQ